MNRRYAPRLGPDDIAEAAQHVLLKIVQQIQDDVAEDPATALSEVAVGKDRKKALRVDVNAEDSFVRRLRKFRSGNFASIEVHGEERLRDPALDLDGADGIFALVDAVDGTDLVERDLSNWCSAAIFFSPKNPAGERILGSFVAVPSGKVYYSTAADDAAFVVDADGPRRLAGPSSTRTLSEASVCFYGQKPDHLLSAMTLARAAEKRGDGFRIYNLAGIPMMVKLADHGADRDYRGIDAVIELLGQKPHDAVPGLYIAIKAGAHALTLDGVHLTPTDLERLLFRPAATESEQRYVLAATQELATEILGALEKEGHGA
jgi:fructose-1,6-bisphosphatase/inositol monophosphatase family enzyme